MDIPQLLASLDQHHAMMFVILAFGWDDLLVAVVLLIISSTITALTTKKPGQTDAQKPAVLTDFDFPQIDEGTSQTVVFGDVWLTGWQVLWYGNLRSQGIPAPKQKGKK